MGDVVLYLPTGQSVRFSHDDFERLGEKKYGEWSIWFSQRWHTLIGDIQFGVSHTENVEEEENRFGGHNAHIHDSFGATQIFASTKENRQGEQVATYPNGSVTAIHEAGLGSIEGTYREVVEPLELPQPLRQIGSEIKKGRGGFGIIFDRFRRK